MKKNPLRAALLIIDMERAFVDAEGGHCIVNAAATIPACAKAAESARERGVPVFFVRREYRQNGSDVEAARYGAWLSSGRSCAPGSKGANSADWCEALAPQSGDYIITKPRWSAFFGTELDLILRRLDIRTVVLAGTTTPNCIRTACYDALALEYSCVVLTDATSSQTEEIQRVNLADMERAGAALMTVERFSKLAPEDVPDLSAAIRAAMESEDVPPENI